jgi:carbon-monoxide dehydrogenase medium subunit
MIEPKVYSPHTIDEAVKLLSTLNGSARIIAGGTDLMVLINAARVDTMLAPQEYDLLNIWWLRGMRHIEDEGACIRIGALSTWSHIIRSSLVREFAPSLVEAARTIGAIQIQNRGTIGGNIVNASPAGDSLPVLAAFDAELELESVRGSRRVAFNDFYTGYRRTVLGSDELLTAVRIPKLLKGESTAFFKVGTRRAQAISKVVMATRARVSRGVIDSIAIGLGSVAPTVIRARETEELLNGKRLNQELLIQAQQTISNEISAISDLRSTEHYRRTVTGRLLNRLLRGYVVSS